MIGEGFGGVEDCDDVLVSVEVGDGEGGAAAFVLGVDVGSVFDEEFYHFFIVECGGDDECGAVVFAGFDFGVGSICQ